MNMKRYLLFLTALITSQLVAQQNTPVLDCRMKHQQQENFKFSQDPHVQATNQRSDTIDILQLTINLNITDFVTDTIRGNTKVRFAPKMNNISTIDLDLLHMTIDSVKLNTSVLSHTYDDTLLKITLPFVHNTTDTSDLIVYYHGKPRLDPAGWGGFYFQSGYAYNLGVGFGSDPHVFGRCWFPCFDNFVERSTYVFNIETNNGKLAYCNGLLALDSSYSGLRLRRWVLNQEIPSYLASVSIAAYTQVNQVFNGMNGPTPIILTALPGDTVNMKASFINLNNALTGFEARYGAYKWDRVGYCLVPFNSGAMEHATNISYPKICANGNLTYEASIMAHELSHHWWGDNATCQNEGEMWLNEGMASYSEHIFTEWVYGYTAYINGIRANHDDMIHYVHHREGGFLTMDSIPHQYTYGDHVYLKGADMAHTLRGYLGDSLFFLGLKYHQNTALYTDVSSLDMRDNMITATGQTAKLTSFFNDWILHPGWPHFSVDSFVSVPNGNNFDVTVYVKQKLRGAPNLYTNVPLEVTFMNNAWAAQTKNILVSGLNSNFTFTLPFDPSLAIIDLNDKISDAITDDTKVLKTTGLNFSFLAEGRIQVTVQNINSGDSAFIHIDHNWATPDPFKTAQPFRLSDHYWTVTGIFPAGFVAKGNISYDGRTTSTSGGSSWMDETIITSNNLEDSVVLFYRKDASADWQLYPYYTKTMGAPTDKFGTILFDSLRAGEYVIGLHDHTAGIQETSSFADVNVFPNPSSAEFTVVLEGPNALNDASVEIYDLGGRKLLTQHLSGKTMKIDDHKWAPGIYILTLRSKGVVIAQKKLSVVR